MEPNVGDGDGHDHEDLDNTMLCHNHMISLIMTTMIITYPEDTHWQQVLHLAKRRRDMTRIVAISESTSHLHMTCESNLHLYPFNATRESKPHHPIRTRTNCINCPTCKCLNVNFFRDGEVVTSQVCNLLQVGEISNSLPTLSNIKFNTKHQIFCPPRYYPWFFI